MNKKLALLAMTIAVVLGAFLPLMGSGVDGLAIPTAQAAQPFFSKPGFQRVWLSTDSLVENGAVQRSYLWGPTIIDANYERYDDAAPVGGERRWVQYFDKTRMEINNPYGDAASQYYVSNGLLVVELVSGRRQDGDSTFFEGGTPANNVPVAGDNIATNPTAPTYRTLRAVASYDDKSVAANRKPNRVGQRVGETLTKESNGDGTVGNNPALANLPGTEIAYYEGTLGHNVPKVFADYMNQIGPKFDVNSRTVVNGQKVFDSLYAMGFPITDAYWAKVKVAGVERDVLVQAFQRRVLTYTPANPAAFQVEMGNVGQHYFVWRYGANGKMPSSEPINAPTIQPLKVPNIGYGLNAHYYYQNREQVTDWVKDLGARWIRQQVTWRDVENATRTDDNRFAWGEVDNIVNHLYLNNVHIILSVIGTPEQYKSSGSGLPDADKVNKFGQFMNIMARRYKGKVDAYEIWNEANLARESGQGINFRRYLGMLQKGYNAVKDADPAAFVVFGSLSPVEQNDPNYAISDTKFLRDMYAFNNGEVKNYFDVMGVHPGGHVNPPDTKAPNGPGPGWKDSNEFYFRRIEDIRKIMEDAGDAKKQIWVTEFGWSVDSNPETGYEYAKVNTEAQQAQYIRGAYEYAQRNYPYVGVMALWNLNFALPTVVINNPKPDGKNDEKIGFGILRRDGSKRPSYFEFQNMARTAR